MKRITALILTVVMLCPFMSFYINAGTDYIIPNPEVTLGITSPTVDGNITKTEGWSGPCYMNEDTLNYWFKDRSLSMWAEVRFAVDKSGFYFSANILDGVSSYDPEYSAELSQNKLCPSSGSPFDPVYAYYNGDSFTLNIDPLGKLYDFGYLGGCDIVPAYTVSVFDDGEFYIRDFEPVTLTEGALVEGSITDDGWCFEAWVSWDHIIDDVYEISCEDIFEGNGNIRLDVDTILADRSNIKVGAIYSDRYNDDGINTTYNIYTTAPEITKGGLPGYNVLREWGIDSLGIELTVSNTCKYSGSHRWSEWIRIIEPTYFEKGKEASICNRCGKVMYREVGTLEYKNNFTDVKNSSWYAESVKYCVMKGYMCGMSAYCFEPDSMLTREQCVLLLANLLEVDTTVYKYKESGFKDVPAGRWYSGAAAWAAECGLIKGMSEDTFGTGQYIKRDAFARILYTAAERLGMPMKARADLSNYVDYDKVPSWAYEEIAWAVANGIITSTKHDVLMLSPRDEVKRSQCATMLMQFGKIIEANSK